MGETEEEGGRDSRLEGDASDQAGAPEISREESGGAPVRRAGGFLRPDQSQRLLDDFYFQNNERSVRSCRRAPGFVAAGCRLQAVQADFESSHCTSRWWSDLQLRFQRRRLCGPKRSMYDVCHSARSELMRDPASPPRSLPDPSQKEWQQAATLSSRLKRYSFELRFLRPASPNLQTRTPGRWYSHPRKDRLRSQPDSLRKPQHGALGEILYP